MAGVEVYWGNSPFFAGFERLNKLMGAAIEENKGYPPYNVAKVEQNEYQITLAVAGFGKEDIKITLHNGVLVVKGISKKDAEGTKYLHRGIAGRSFERRFALDEYIEVEGSTLVDGLLRITLRYSAPEEGLPKVITIA